MAGLFENKQVLTRIFIGIFVGLIAVSMLLYLVPQGPGAGAASTDTVATVGGQSISLQDIQQQLTQISQRTKINHLRRPHPPLHSLRCLGRRKPFFMPQAKGHLLLLRQFLNRSLDNRRQLGRVVGQGDALNPHGSAPAVRRSPPP